MFDVFLFRHAHVDYQPPAKITAHNPLTQLGCQMAARLAERCDEWGLQYLLVSTMLRAQQTADAISERFPDLPRLDMSEFEEVGIKDLEGYPGRLPTEDLRTWEGPHWTYARVDRRGRVKAGWEKVHRVVAENGLERVAIVSHSGPLNLLLRHFVGAEDLLDICWFEFDWTATSCVRFTPEDEWTQKRIRWVNDARHIDDLRRLLAPGDVGW